MASCCRYFVEDPDKISSENEKAIATWIVREPNHRIDLTPEIQDVWPERRGILSPHAWDHPDALLDELFQLGAHKTGISKILAPEAWRQSIVHEYRHIPPTELVIPRQQTIAVDVPDSLYLITAKKLPRRRFMKYLETDIPVDNFMNLTVQQGHDLYHETLRRSSGPGEYGIYAPDIETSLMPDSCQVMNFNRWRENRHNWVNELREMTLSGHAGADGFTTAYVYANNEEKGPSYFGMHVEDMNLHSMNVCYAGWKYWMGIFVEDKYRFEDILRVHSPEDWRLCNYALAHKRWLATTSFLKSHGVRYVELVQKPGEVVVTFPGGIHFGANIVTNTCEAIAAASRHYIPHMIVAPECSCKPEAKLPFDRLKMLKVMKLSLSVTRTPYSSRDPFVEKKVKIQQHPSLDAKNERREAQKHPQSVKKHFPVQETAVGKEDTTKYLRLCLNHAEDRLYSKVAYQKWRRREHLFKNSKDNQVKVHFEKVMESEEALRANTIDLTEEEIEGLRPRLRGNHRN